MNNDKRQRLEEAIVAIRRAHGPDAVRPADALRPRGDVDEPSAIPHLPTGFAKAAFSRFVRFGQRQRN